MKKLALTMVLALGFTACGKDQSAEVAKFADKACACADAACATAVANDFAKWISANKDAKGNQSKAEASAKKMMECLIKKGGDIKQMMEAFSKAAK